MKSKKLSSLIGALSCAIFLAACSNASGGGGTSGGTETNGAYMTFGSWPQTEKVNSVTVNESENKTVGDFTYYKGSDGEWYAKKNSKYYKVEPIKWRVLPKNYNGTGKKLLHAEKILDWWWYYCSSGFRTVDGKTVYPNNYEYSIIRALLNGLSYQKKDSDESSQVVCNDLLGKGFLQTAFTTEEIATIADTSVDNSASSTNPAANATQWNGGENQYACDTSTNDKIFLLSEQEVTTSTYGFVVYDAGGAGNKRIRQTTDYAKSRGAFQSTTAGMGGWWWLRSPSYETSSFVRVIGENGRANECFDMYQGGGVVPVLCLK